jgi:molybdate transport system regulatory protein
VKPKLKVWVVFGEQTKFGDGRAQLLELINELGSMKKAVTRLGMSYRNAWGYLQELENAAGFKFLERKPGGGPRGGTRLTKEGEKFLRRYWQFRKGVDKVASRHFEKSFKNR